jgi:hypothetical protein
MKQLADKKESANGVLALLGVLDKQTLANVLNPATLKAVIESKGLAALIARGENITLGDLRNLFQRGFDGKIEALDAWAVELQALAADVQDSVLAALRRHVEGLSPTSALALLKLGVALDETTLAGLDALARGSSRADVDALVAKNPPRMAELLQHAGQHPGDAPALAALAKHPDLAPGLIDAMETMGELAEMLEACAGDAKFFSDVVATISPRPSASTLYLEAAEKEGLKRILRVARQKQAEAKTLLATRERARAFMRAAADATDHAIEAALARGHFDPWATPKKMRDQFKDEEIGGVPPFRTQYFDPALRAPLRVTVRGGRLWNPDGTPVDTSTMRTFFSGSGRAIYVMDLYGDMYISVQKLYEIHHSSILAGKPVGCAGEIQVNNGTITFISNKSGHYFPTGAQFDAFLESLERRGATIPDRTNPAQVKRYR